MFFRIGSFISKTLSTRTMSIRMTPKPSKENGPLGKTSVEFSVSRHYHDWLSATLSTDSRLISLDGVTLMDVELGLGTPYLYKHGLSGCEHFVVFTDVRFLHADDELDLALYPRLLFQAPMRLPVCAICSGRST